MNPGRICSISRGTLSALCAVATLALIAGATSVEARGCPKTCRKQFTGQKKACRSVCPKAKAGKACRAGCAADLKADTMACKTATSPTPPSCRQTACGTFVTKWGSLGTGPGQFMHAVGIATHGDDVYISDVTNRTIQKFTSDGTFITQWGGSGSADGAFGVVGVPQSGPFGMAFDPSGNLFVSDGSNTSLSNNRVQKFTSDGMFLLKWGRTGSGDGQLNGPTSPAVDAAGNIYVPECGNSRVQKFSGDGVFITKWGESGDSDGQFSCPVGMAVDQAGNVYVGDIQGNRIQKFTNTGTFITTWGELGPDDGQFSNLLGVAVGRRGHVFAVDDQNYRIQEFTSSGAFVGKWGEPGTGDGQFQHPTGIAVDASHNVYVLDTDNHRVQKFACP